MILIVPKRHYKKCSTMSILEKDVSMFVTFVVVCILCNYCDIIVIEIILSIYRDLAFPIIAQA